MKRNTLPIHREFTAEDRATIAKMAAEDAFAREIAEALGRTKNSIIGYCARNNIRLGARRKYGPRSIASWWDESEGEWVDDPFARFTGVGA